MGITNSKIKDLTSIKLIMSFKLQNYKNCIKILIKIVSGNAIDEIYITKRKYFSEFYKYFYNVFTEMGGAAS